MNKLKISKYLMFLSMMTFLAIFFHIVETSYNKLMQPSKDLSKSDLLKPINPNLEVDVLNQIEKRLYNEKNNLITEPDPIITIVPTPIL